MEGRPPGWNPGTSDAGTEGVGYVAAAVYPSVFVLRPDFTVELDRHLMVSATQVDDDPQTIEYVIRDDAVWSDGTPIGADDFAYAWEQQSGRIEGNDVADTTGYEDIERVTGSEGGKKVTVVFSRAATDWKRLFSNLLPAHVMKTVDGGWNDGLDGARVPRFSGGPFEVQSYVEGQQATLVRNERYFGPKPHLDRIVVRFGVEPGALAQAFADDEIDVAYVPRPQVELVQQFEPLAPAIVTRVETGLEYEHLDFDLENEFLEDLAVRRAIAHGLDRDAIVARTAGRLAPDGARLDNRVWVNGQPEYGANGAAYHQRSVPAAEQALAGAGFAKGGDGIFRKGGRKLSLRISTTGGDELREETVAVIRAQLAEVGIEIVVDNVAGDALLARIFPEDPADRDFDIALFSWRSAPFLGTHRAAFSTGGARNETGYSNQQVDDLLKFAAVNTDREGALDQLDEADQLMWSDLPTIPLYARPTFLAHRATIVNVESNATARGPLWNAADWAREG